jgi:hypothetical protein
LFDIAVVAEHAELAIERMSKRMVPDDVAVVNDAPEQLRRPVHARTNDEEHPAHVIPPQDIQNGWSAVGVRAVIKSQENGVSPGLRKFTRRQ